jgi:hypothetical protein
MSLIKDIQNSFHSLIDHLKTTAIGFFDALAHSIEQNGGQVLRDAAIAAVRAAEATGGSGDQKFAAALAQVVITLETEGLPVVINAVKGAIEAAVAVMKADPKPEA